MPQMVFPAVALEEQRRNRFFRVLLPLAKRVVELPDDGIAGVSAFGFNQHDTIFSFVSGINFRLYPFGVNLKTSGYETKLRCVLSAAYCEHKGIVIDEIPDQTQCIGAIQVLHFRIAHV